MGIKEDLEGKLMAFRIAHEQGDTRHMLDLTDAETILYAQQEIETITGLPYLEALRRHQAGAYRGTRISEQMSYLQGVFLRPTEPENLP